MFLAAQADAEASPWLKLNTSNFQIYGQTSEKSLKDVGRQFEAAAEILDALEPPAGRSRNPVRVFVFNTRREFEQHRVSGGASKTGYYHAASASEVIAILHSESGDSRLIFHEYAHLALHRAGGRVPLWLDEGLAELYSSIHIRGSELYWGGPLASHVDKVLRKRPLDAAAFFSVHREADEYVDPVKAGIFYAQSWAFTHMLQLAPEYAGKLPVFRTLLTQGLPETEAFEAAFGKSQADALEDLGRYVQTGRFEERRLPIAAPAAVPTLRVQRSSPEEASFALAHLLMHIGKTDKAWRIYKDLSSEKLSDGELVKSLGDLALAHGRREEARLYYERAMALGLKDANLYFEYAMLQRDEGASKDRIGELLKLALQLNPNLPGVHQFLGNRALDDGDHETAIELLTRGTVLEPASPSLWLSLALAYRAAGDHDKAIAAASEARQRARESTEIRMAESVMEGLMLLRETATAPEVREATVTPESWKNRQGNRKLEGALVQVDCLGESARLHVRVGDKIEVLSVSDPSKVVLRNAAEPNAELRCGAAGELPVAVEYVAQHVAGTSGEVTSLEFK